MAVIATPSAILWQVQQSEEVIVWPGLGSSNVDAINSHFKLDSPGRVQAGIQESIFDCLDHQQG